MPKYPSDENLCRGFEFAIRPEDVETTPKWCPPGYMSDYMRGGINDSGTAQQSGPEPYFDKNEGWPYGKEPAETFQRDDSPRNSNKKKKGASGPY